MVQGIYVILFCLNEENELFVPHSKYHPGLTIWEVLDKEYKK
jgi:hypothetical protein